MSCELALITTKDAKKMDGQVSRSISTGQLNVLPRLHFRPINLVVFEGPSGAYARDT